MDFYDKIFIAIVMIIVTFSCILDTFVFASEPFYESSGDATYDLYYSMGLGYIDNTPVEGISVFYGRYFYVEPGFYYHLNFGSTPVATIGVCFSTSVPGKYVTASLDGTYDVDYQLNHDIYFVPDVKGYMFVFGGNASHLTNLSVTSDGIPTSVSSIEFRQILSSISSISSSSDRVVTSIDNQTNTINNSISSSTEQMTNTISSTEYDEDSISVSGGAFDDFDDSSTTSFFTTLFNKFKTLIDSSSWDTVTTIDIGIPFVDNAKITLTSDILSNIVGNSLLKTLISLSWYSLFGLYLFKFVNKLYNSIKSGSILDGFNPDEVITSEML